MSRLSVAVERVLLHTDCHLLAVLRPEGGDDASELGLVKADALRVPFKRSAVGLGYLVGILGWTCHTWHSLVIVRIRILLLIVRLEWLVVICIVESLLSVLTISLTVHAWPALWDSPLAVVVI